MAIMIEINVWEPQEWKVHRAEAPVAEGRDNTWMVQKGQSKLVRSEILPAAEAYAAAEEELELFNRVSLTAYDTNWGRRESFDSRIIMSELSEIG